MTGLAGTSRFPAIAFALVPILALELMVLFRRRVRYFVQHLITALHLQSFFFVILTVTTLISLVTGEGVAELLLVSSIAIYAYRALRAVYWEQSRPAVVLKMIAQFLVHSLVIGVALLATFVLVGLSL